MNDMKKDSVKIEKKHFKLFLGLWIIIGILGLIFLIYTLFALSYFLQDTLNQKIVWWIVLLSSLVIGLNLYFVLNKSKRTLFWVKVTIWYTFIGSLIIDFVGANINRNPTITILRLVVILFSAIIIHRYVNSSKEAKNYFYK